MNGNHQFFFSPSFQDPLPGNALAPENEMNYALRLHFGHGDGMRGIIGICSPGLELEIVIYI